MSSSTPVPLPSDAKSSQTPPSQGAFAVPEVLEQKAMKKIESIVSSELKIPGNRGREVAARITEEVRQVLVFEMQESHSGPIPSSAEMQGYEEACPGLANRITKMAEIEQAARISWYNKVLYFQFALALFGQVFAFAFGVGLLLAAYFLGMAGHDWLAGVAITGGGISLASTFLKRLPLIRGNSASEADEEQPGVRKPSSRRRHSGKNRSLQKR